MSLIVPSRAPLKIPLCVPYWEQGEALDKGALYDKVFGFYVGPVALLEELAPWLPARYNPFVDKPVLQPEMLPATTWGENVRGLLGEDVWDRMRKHAYAAAGYRCEICGTNGPMEAHEKWLLINETCVQKLVRIQCLCPVCHKCHHLGIAKRLGMLTAVHAHMQAVNGWTQAQMHLEVKDMYEVWQQRTDWPWSVDLSWLQDYGYVYV